MKDVKGKVAFITGGASGIGLGMSKVFVNAGINVVIADVRQDHLDQAMHYFEKAKKRLDCCAEMLHGGLCHRL